MFGRKLMGMCYTRAKAWCISGVKYSSATNELLSNEKDSSAQCNEDNVAKLANSDDLECVVRQLPYMNAYVPPRQVWVVNMDAVEEKPLTIVDVHPEIFAARPRVDIINDNKVWQTKYKYVSYAHSKVRHEVNRSSKKPWPQKGTGRARHSSRRSPMFVGGAIIHGPRNPTSHFYMLPYWKRVAGLCSTLSVKLAQDDLHVVKDLEIPSDDPKYLTDLAEARNWGSSILFVDVDDVMPKNMTIATDGIKYMNLMPVYGLNVYSMLKHETLVLTYAALERIEEKLLFALHRKQEDYFQNYALGSVPGELEYHHNAK